jgi:polysaccharide export outer membrane protein
MTARFHLKNIADFTFGVVVVIALGAPLYAQTPAVRGTASSVPAVPPLAVPPGYVIGPDDVLTVVYWRDREMTTDAVVRPDGKISLPLLNEIQAAGLTPSELREHLTVESKRYIEDPNVTVVVKQINSRRVFVLGEVGKPGLHPLTAPTTVLQLLAAVGGLKEYADSKKIVIIRNENGRQTTFRFNYKDVTSGKNLRQNIELMPGDTIIVP